MKIKNLLSHKTKHQVLLKFIAVLILFISYFAYLSFKFDIITGGMVALLTWSFFVLATPVADAGFLLDFPLRLIFGIRMFISEIFVWLIAISINIFALSFMLESYDTTFITSLLERIILNPYPYWAIFILSGMGTFLSVKIGDELLDVVHHKERIFHHKHSFKLEILLFICVFILIIVGYQHLLNSLGIHLA